MRSELATYVATLIASDCTSLVCRAQLVFVTLPTNQTVTEGGDVNFTCSTALSGIPDPVQWQLRGGEGNIDERLQVSTANIPGVESIIIAGGLRSPITFRNVSRSLDSLFVSCLGEDAQGRIVEQSDPPAVLSVLCEFSARCFSVSHATSSQ